MMRNYRDAPLRGPTPQHDDYIITGTTLLAGGTKVFDTV